MKRNVLFKCVISFLFIIYMMAYMTQFDLTAEAKTENKDQYRILFLSAYIYEPTKMEQLLEGLIGRLNFDEYIFDYEFMDVDNTNYSPDFNEFYQLIHFKMNNSESYDGIIVTDDITARFVANHREDLFSNLPVVFMGLLENEVDESLLNDSLTTGIFDRYNYFENIEVALSFYPKASHLVILHNGKNDDRNYRDELIDASARYKDFTIEQIDFSTYEEIELIEKLRSIPNDSIVFSFSLSDLKNRFQWSSNELQTFFKQHLMVPIFSVSNDAIYSGAIGGFFTNQFSAGELAGDMIRTIFETNRIPDAVYAPSMYVFDYDHIKSFNISTLKLPKETIVLNKPKSFSQKYGLWIIYFLAFGFFLLLSINYYRGLTNRKLKETNKKLLVAESNLREQHKRNQKNHEELVKQEAYIRYQAEHDYLTNLPNRSVVMKKLEKYSRDGIPFSIFIIDFNDFKELNDTYGHAYGDAALQIIAVRFLNLLEDNHLFVARFGSDEFLAILKKPSENELNETIEKIKEIFHAPIVHQGIESYIEMSMGIAHSKDIAKDISDVISNAHIALYEAKKERRNAHVFFTPTMRDRLEEVKLVREILTKACDEDGFDVLYQPQIDVKTRTVCSYEALVRLKDSDISPAQFIPIAEESDLILRIGRIVTQKVVDQLVQWRENEMPLLPVAINFCTKQIRDKHYVKFLQYLLEKNNLSPKLIEIEFTESIFIDNDEQALCLFEDFKQLGVSMALDDFGTGYSSISYLTYIPVQKVKIDKSLMDIFLKEEKDQFIKNLIQLLHSLDLSITAEGIETEEQYCRLKQFGCDYVQGFLFSTPINGEQVESFTIE